MAIFYRLSMFDAMADEVESEHAFAAPGTSYCLVFRGPFCAFPCMYIVDSALDWRFTSGLVPLI
jgi:hypothetical protein